MNNKIPETTEELGTEYVDKDRKILMNKQAKEYGVNLDDSTISKIESEMKWKRMENTKNY